MRRPSSTMSSRRRHRPSADGTSLGRKSGLRAFGRPVWVLDPEGERLASPPAYQPGDLNECAGLPALGAPPPGGGATLIETRFSAAPGFQIRPTPFFVMIGVPSIRPAMFAASNPTACTGGGERSWFEQEQSPAGPARGGIYRRPGSAALQHRDLICRARGPFGIIYQFYRPGRRRASDTCCCAGNPGRPGARLSGGGS